MKPYFERIGEGSDLVLIHGWGMHGGVWEGIARYLAEHHRVTVVDLPGHGRSRRTERLTLDNLVDAVAATTPNPAVWMGWSLGGLVALAAALGSVRDAVNGLILVSTTPKFTASADWNTAMSPATLQQFAAELVDDYEDSLWRFLTLHVGGADGATETLRTLRAVLMRHGAPDRLALLDAMQILANTDIREEVAKVSIPVQIIHGDRDRLSHPGAAEELARRMPNARLKMVAGAGHAPFLSHTNVFIDCLEGYLRERRSARPG